MGPRETKGVRGPEPPGLCGALGSRSDWRENRRSSCLKR